ncbi:type II toxin-antitoxin system VapC family toxin [Flectobacillus roseus]|uniref:Type II toxin-antitoxin system VapC family toxin n=1 Tax=Flectobacillus roseus TaxID=502259 RepID=A0ABT6YEB1_9BACT|nr:type II toxin-antitoxin system VapC family toxin [Flectobacillus roseus]MDI9861937.1 type II toxin-antitoxin system VapC family toxin [Flectobacillus roseus]
MGKRYLIDTNVVSKYFEETLSEHGLMLLDHVLDNGQAYISVITRIELLSFAPKNQNLLASINIFIDACQEFWISEEIVQQTIKIRKMYKVKLPDATIASTAMCYDLILLSDNDSDFGKIPTLRYINPRKYQLATS